MRVGAAGAAGVIFGDGWRLCSSTAEAQQWSPALATLGEPIPTTCGMCPAGCGLLCYRDGDALRGIFGNPSHPENRGKICAKGIAGLNYVFDPQRILYPMRRTGARGEGKWRRITWDEAYHTIASKLSLLMKEGRIDEAFFDVRKEERLVSRFFNALEHPTVLNRSKLGNLNKRLAHKVTWGAEGEIVDPSTSSYVLVFGSNPLEHHDSHVALAQRLIEGKVNHGTKLVTLDVRHSNTAAKSDEAFMIKPGTDGIIALAMANVIMKQNLYDAEFLDKWTNYPSQRLTPHLGPYPPERAADESGMRADDIRRIAVEFARAKPAAILSGGGVSKHRNGLQNERCILLLAALTGNVDVEGGCGLPRELSLLEPDPGPPQRSEEIEHLQHPSSLLSFLETKDTIDFYMTCQSNPVYDDPETERTAEALKDEEKTSFSIAFDTHLTETGALADMFLPASTFLEGWDVETRPSKGHLSLRQPVIQRGAETEFLRKGLKISSIPFQPLGASVSASDMYLEVAKRMGGDMKDYFPFNSTEEYLGRIVPPNADPGWFQELKETGFWMHPEGEQRYRRYTDRGFHTPSGKFEIYSETLRKMGVSPLPVYDPIPDHARLDDHEFILTTYTPNVHTRRTGNCKWLTEIMHDNPVWMNTGAAKARGIQQGDTLRISSPVGDIAVRVLLTEGIHPNTIAIAQGCGHREWGTVARAERQKTEDRDTNLVWWKSVGNGIHPNAIIPVATHPKGGGQAWHDTKVCIEKI
ncbi:MAG: molybdopterin-dependent oxidoreductase [Gemmatimonadota bacterium]|nr:MAG: molybdopterin-dependent oxidoreductase [Gemmatimonadota bacterium]